MKKKRLCCRFGRKFAGGKLMLVMKLSVFLILTMTFTVLANVNVLSQTVNLDFREAKLNDVFRSLREQTGQVIIYSDTKLESESTTVTLKMANVSLAQALEQVLKGLPYSYTIEEGVVYIIPQATPAGRRLQQATTVSVEGTVTDTNGKPLPGVTVVARMGGSTGSPIGVATGADGKYKLSWPQAQNVVLVFSYIGLVTQEVPYTGQPEINVVMKEDTQLVEEVVVTGYFERTKQSFTGAEVTVKGEELRQVGSMNLLTAISLFDPSVRTIPNNEYGSDPNRVPEISIRGENGFDLRSTADDSRSNPNAPLYILDGIEVSPSTVYDLDQNRVESFTILKDAAATALYGSRGANGVIIVATVRPRAGELRVNVNANYTVSIPDLRDYNLMNAREKLEYERRAGLFEASNWEDQLSKDIQYNDLLSEVERGVDTYWLSKPLRTSVNQRYNAFIEGGDEYMRYGVDLRYDTDKGVMKKSGRDRYGINVSLNYRVSNKLMIYNVLSVDDVTGSNSPYGSFSDYARMNPYERLYDPETGEMIRYYEKNSTKNPLINGLLPNTDTDRYTEIKDNLRIEWRINDHLMFKGLAALTKNMGRREIYRSPDSSDFDNETDPNKKGALATFNSNSMKFDGNISLDYNNVFYDKFTVSAGVGAEMSTYKLNGDGFTGIGFLNDKQKNVEFAQSVKKITETNYYDRSSMIGFDKTRMVGFFANVNVGYDNRYFVEGSFRTDGSSKFGRNSRFAPFWAVGAAWNINNEQWWTGPGVMKLRASVGNTGSTNFDSDQAVTKFLYSGESEYNGVYGAILSSFGNPGLKWQNTIQYNVGLETVLWKNIISLNVDFYLKRTQNLLLSVDIPPSTGFSSYRENMGSIDNRGFDGRLRVNLIQDRQRDLIWSVTLRVAHNKNEIRKLSTAMKAMNEAALDIENSTGKQVFRLYEEGRSQSALMVVRSLGIDPMTGREIYIKRDGTLTFDYDPNDKVMVGDSNPNYQGSVQTNLYWKGFNLFLSFGYEQGAKIFNQTLATKVEGAQPLYNADRRVLYDRWYQPGDQTTYRDIRNTSSVYQTTRLVQKNDFLSLTNASLSYDLPRRLLEGTFLERVRATISTTDLFRISTIRQERGTTYPFARTFTFGFSVTF